MAPDEEAKGTDTNVLKFEPQEVGVSYRFDADQTLDEAKGQNFHRLVIVGELEDGTPWLTGNANSGEVLILLERAKHRIVFEE